MKSINFCHTEYVSECAKLYCVNQQGEGRHVKKIMCSELK